MKHDELLRELDFWAENSRSKGVLFAAAAKAIRRLLETPERKNEPLTWKDLAYMDGEPIWAEILEGDDVSAWEIFFADNYEESEYGVLWLAYLYGKPTKAKEGAEWLR